MDEKLKAPPLWRDARAIWALIRDSAYAWSEDRASRKGAALAYYMAFSLAPMLIIATAVAGLFFGQAAARGQIFDQAKDLFGADGARVVQAMIANAGRPGRGTWPTILGIVTIVVGATSALAELKDGLDQIWNTQTGRTFRFGHYLLDFARTRLLAIGIILTLGLLLILSLVLSALLAGLSHRVGVSDTTNFALQAFNFLLSFGLVTALFATIYKVLPAVPLAWRDVIVGAVVTAVLFNVGKHVIAVYLGGRASTSTYGAAGSLLVVLVWVYYSAQIFLFGAEFTKVYARRYGSLRRVERPPTAPGPGMSGAPGPVAGAATSASALGAPPRSSAAGAPGVARAGSSAPAPRLDSRRTIGEARTQSDDSDR
ncbi:MAG TPA: YhjD/YihY/BrkB family envelope integrity protein [Steroidobacteraceae bacterium]|nr:YhjD/YihY/BrkB family envelope integrity protein [Steroidobacteraceae bacterium]